MTICWQFDDGSSVTSTSYLWHRFHIQNPSLDGVGSGADNINCHEKLKQRGGNTAAKQRQRRREQHICMGVVHAGYNHIQFILPNRFVTKGNIMGKRGETGNPVCGHKAVHVWCVRLSHGLATLLRKKKCADSLKVVLQITEVFQQRCGPSRVYFGAG